MIQWSKFINQTLEYSNKNQNVQAAQACQSALDVAGRSFGPKSDFFVLSEVICGNAYMGTGDYNRAEALLLASIKSIETLKEKDDIEIIGPLNDLSRLYIVTNRKEDAEKTLKKVLGVYEKLNHGDYHQVLNNWKESEAVFKTSRYEGIETPFLLLRTIDPKAAAMENLYLSSEYARTFNRLRQLYEDNGRWAEAEGVAKKSIEIFQQLYGSNHEYVENISIELAKIYRMQGKWQEAADTYEKVLSISIKQHGQNSFKTLSILEGMWAVYKEMGNVAKAEEYQQKIDELKEQVQGH